MKRDQVIQEDKNTISEKSEMNYSDRLRHRREEEATQQQLEKEATAARNERRRNVLLLASTILTFLAIVVIAPMRFKAVAGEEVDPVEMYLASNVDENITQAENEVDATFANNNQNSFMMFAESIKDTSFENLQTTEHKIRMKFLQVEREFATEGVTLDDVFATEESAGHVIGQFENAVPLLDPGEDSLYYVAMIDSSSFNDYGQVRQAVFAQNTDDAKVLDDILYDYETGIAYIPKTYYNDAAAAPQSEEEGEEEVSVDDLDNPNLTPAEEEATEDGQDAEVTDEELLDQDAIADQDGDEEQTEQLTDTVADEDADEKQPAENDEADEDGQEADNANAPPASDESLTTEGVVSGEVKTDEVLSEDGIDPALYSTISPEDLAALQNAEPLEVPTEIQPMDDQQVAAISDLLEGEQEPTVVSDIQTEEDLERAIMEDSIVVSPIQGELLISYDLNNSLTDDVTIPVDIVSEVPGIQAAGIYDLTVPSFDVTISLQIVTPESAGLVNPNNVLIYEGGSDSPLVVNGDEAIYDAETGTLTINKSPLAVTSLRIVLASDDTLTQVMDALLGTEPAVALNADEMNAWPNGKFTNLDIDKLKQAIGNAQKFEYNANSAFNDAHDWAGDYHFLRNDPVRQNWSRAMYASRPYLYAQADSWGSMPWLSGDALQAAIRGNTPWPEFATLHGKNNSNDWVPLNISASANRHDGSSGAGGTLTGVFSLPGDTGPGDNQIATNIGGLDWSGLQSLIEPGTTHYLMAGGACCHVDNGRTSGRDYTYYNAAEPGIVIMRPLYLANDESYVVIGFVAIGQKMAWATQSYTAIYKFRLDSKRELYVQKQSSNAGITDKYPEVFAKNGKGAVFGVYNSEGEARAGSLGGNGQANAPAIATLTVGDNGLSNVAMVSPRIYWLMELAAPAGYKKLDHPVSINVTADRRQNVATIPNEPNINNKFRVQKVSANPTISDNPLAKDQYATNGEGAVFGVYETKADADAASVTNPGNPLTKLTVGSDGYTPYHSVTTYDRSYWIKEIKAPKGFYANTDTFEVKVKVTDTVTVPVKDNPKTVSVEVVKVDAETNKTPTDGEFEFAIYDANKQELTAAGRKKSVNGAKVSWTGLPFGTYYIKETAASYPYMVNDNFITVDATNKEDVPVTNATTASAESVMAGAESVGAEGAMMVAEGASKNDDSGAGSETYSTGQAVQQGYKESDEGMSLDPQSETYDKEDAQRQGYQQSEDGTTVIAGSQSDDEIETAMMGDTPIEVEEAAPAPSSATKTNGSASTQGTSNTKGGSTSTATKNNTSVATKKNTPATQTGNTQAQGATATKSQEPDAQTVASAMTQNSEPIPEAEGTPDAEEAPAATTASEPTPTEAKGTPDAEEAPSATTTAKVEPSVKASADALTFQVVVPNTQRRGQVSVLKTDKYDGTKLEGVTFRLVANQEVKSPDGTLRHENGKPVPVKATKDAGVYEFDPSSKTVAMKTNAQGTVLVKGLYLTKGNTTFQFEETATIDGHVINRTPVVLTIKKDETTATPSASGALENDINSIDIYKKALKDDTPLAGVTMALWNSKDDLVVAKADGATNYDSIAIRTPDGSEDYRPVIVKRTGSATVSATGIPEGYLLVGDTDASIEGAKKAAEQEAEQATKESATAEAEGADDEAVANAEVTDTKSEESVNVPDDAFPGDDEGDTKDTENGDAEKGTPQVQKAETPLDIEAKKHLFAFGASSTADDKVSIQPGVYRVSLIDANGTVAATASDELGIIGDASSVAFTVSNKTINGTSEKTGNQGVNATVEWDESQSAWVANDLVPAGADYNIEMGGRTVKVIKTSETGGVTHFGRYSKTDDGLFAQGWLDQASLPKSDANIITKVAISGTEYEYGTVTDEEGHIHIARLPFGDFTLVEAKPISGLHTTYLVDTNAHHFNVKKDEGLIKDTDDLASGYHDGTEGEYTQNKAFIFKDDVTKLKVSKREMTGGPEIEGATLTLTTFEENDIIDEWVSTTEPHYIEGLKPGTYWLTERITPNNYDQAESIKFTLLPTGEIQHVEMLDAPIVIDVEVDKRQEIAKPLNEKHMENGDGKNNAKVSVSPFGYYDYSVDFRNLSNTWTDEFTIEDPLDLVADDMGRVTGISTPQAWQDYDGKMNVWYKTNKDDERAAGKKSTKKADSKKDDATDDATDGKEETEADDKDAKDSDSKDDTKADTKADAKDGKKEGTGKAATAESASDETSTDEVAKTQEITEADATELAGVTVSVAGMPVSNFDVRQTGSSVDITGMDEIIAAMPKIAEHPDYLPVFANLPEGWTAKHDADHFASGQRRDVSGTVVTSDTVYMILSNSKHSYTYAIDYRYTTLDVEAVNARYRELFNATRSDGHVNPWLDDETVMEEDTDKDGRIIDYEGWNVWAKDISTMVSTDLKVSDLNLAADEYITGIRFEYGRVESKFTTRPDEWDRALLKDEHDDMDDILSVADRSFENADVAADAAVKTIDRIVSTFTSEASKEAEADLKSKTEEDQIRYEQLLKEIEEYNANRDAESGLPERFLEVRLKPAFEGDDDDATKITAARDAGNLSIAAAFTLDDTAEGRLVLRKATDSVLSDIKNAVSDGTYAALLELVLAYDSSYMSSDPELYSTAKTNLVNGLGIVINEIAETGLTGRVHYSPAILHMQATENYVPDTELHNTVKADAYRNGGGDGLEDHDKDEVRQRAKVRDMRLATVLTADGGKKELSYNLDGTSEEAIDMIEVSFVDTVTYSGLRPGVEYAVIGELHIKNGGNDGGPVVSGGKTVRSTVVFTPENESGTIEVPMKATVGSFSPNSAVAFEELHLSVNGQIADQVLAEHKDINDADQTVGINKYASDDVVVVPESVRRIFKGTPLAQTGDAVVIGGAAAIAAAGIVAFVMYRRRHSA